MSEEEACKFESTGKNEVKSIINYNENQFPRLMKISILFILIFDSFLDTESNESCQTDYSEKRAIPISIPTLHVKNKNGDRYVVSFLLKRLKVQESN